MRCIRSLLFLSLTGPTLCSTIPFTMVSHSYPCIHPSIHVSPSSSPCDVIRISNQDHWPPCLMMVFHTPWSCHTPCSTPQPPHTTPACPVRSTPDRGLGLALPPLPGCLRLCHSQLGFSHKSWSWTTGMSHRPRERRDEDVESAHTRREGAQVLRRMRCVL